MKRSPNTRQLEERLAQWRKETQLQDRFYESRGAHFSVLFEGPADEALARSIVERLEAAYWRVGMALTAHPPKAITVVLYTTEHRDVTRMPEWTVAAYDGRIHVPVRGALQQVDRSIAYWPTSSSTRWWRCWADATCPHGSTRDWPGR